MLTVIPGASVPSEYSSVWQHQWLPVDQSTPTSLFSTCYLFPMKSFQMRTEAGRRHLNPPLEGCRELHGCKDLHYWSRRLFHSVNILIKTPHYLYFSMSIHTHSQYSTILGIRPELSNSLFLMTQLPRTWNKWPYYSTLSSMILGVCGHRPQGNKIMYLNSQNV